MSRTAVPIYAITLILSAFLLFSVQPMFARMILPLLGGTSSVWNVSMLFFQACLLGGYAYTHLSSRFLSIRVQALIHLGLLLLCMVFLPVLVDPATMPGPNPALWQLGLMLSLIGGPFMVVSASAPMIQRWFTATGHKDAANPYFLYAASNIGSLGALVSYPLVVEPLLTLHGQSHGWAAGYGALIALTALCALVVWKNREAAIRPTAQSAAVPTPDTKTRLTWLGLAFIPASLLLGVTAYITTDLASAPMLWVVPLTLYLLTFIIVFARRQWIGAGGVLILFYISLFVLLALQIFKMALGVPFPLFFHLLTFFAAALLCHKKLADLRPHAAHLTEYYMIMSLGGVLGGVFNALLAPVLFPLPIEYTLMLCVVLCVTALYDRNKKIHIPYSKIKPWMIYSSAAGLITLMIYLAIQDMRLLASFYGCIALLFAFALTYRKTARFVGFGTLVLIFFSPLMSTLVHPPIRIERNFFGVSRVIEKPAGVHNLYHGTTMHGVQVIDPPEERTTPTTYYHASGAFGDIFALLDERMGVRDGGVQRVAVLGLGIGTLAAYGREGRHFDFYEIDEAVMRIAEDPALFTYLADTKSTYSLILGDARLKLREVEDGYYEAIIADAFSSDNIPIHLLTREALHLYMHKTNAFGLIALHLSNRYLYLEQQLHALSADTHVPALIRRSRGFRPTDENSKAFGSDSIVGLMTTDPETLIKLQQEGRWKVPNGTPRFRVWTDDYANILSVYNPKKIRYGN